jgi:hypothetical protein
VKKRMSETVENQNVTQSVEQPVELTEQKTEQFTERTITVTMDASLYNIINKLTTVLGSTEYHKEETEVYLSFNTDGLTIRQMNGEHTTMIDLKYPASLFSRYDVSLPMLFPFRQNSIIKKAKDEVTLQCTEQKDKWTYTISEGTMITSKTEVNKIEVNAEYNIPKSPIVYLPVKVTMLKKVLLDVLRNKEVDYVTFEAISEVEVKITLLGNVYGEVRLTPREVGVVQILIEPHTTEAKATYSVKYLKDILQAVPSEQIVFAYGHKQPCKITFKLDEAQISYYVAPRAD